MSEEKTLPTVFIVGAAEDLQKRYARELDGLAKIVTATTAYDGVALLKQHKDVKAFIVDGTVANQTYLPRRLVRAVHENGYARPILVIVPKSDRDAVERFKAAHCQVIHPQEVGEVAQVVLGHHYLPPRVTRNRRKKQIALEA